MADRAIQFYIPKNETIPTMLRLYVDNMYVTYRRIANGFVFNVLTDDEDLALEVVQAIADRMMFEHDESEHGVSWRTVSMKVLPQEPRFKVGTDVEWIYRVRDAY